MDELPPTFPPSAAGCHAWWPTYERTVLITVEGYCICGGPYYFYLKRVVKGNTAEAQSREKLQPQQIKVYPVIAVPQKTRLAFRKSLTVLRRA